MDIATIGIIGAGAMGRGIAQLAAEAGLDVLVHDKRASVAAEARDFAREMIARHVAKGRVEAASGERLRVCTSLAEFAACDVVVEAITEDLEAKRALFAGLEDVVSDHALLVTNTSSLSITEIAAACTAPERVAGFHFFNPVPVMKVIEVIDGARTAPATIETLRALAGRLGHRPVIVADTPGFLVNHAGRGYTGEALRALDEGVADHVTIDRILRDGIGFRMGPFELLDFVGLDVSQRVMEQIYEQFYQEQRFRPIPATRRRVAAGLLGRKTGEGFYRYADGKRIEPPMASRQPGDVGSVAIAEPVDEEARAALVVRLESAGVPIAANPEDCDLHIVLPTGSDCTGAALEHGFPPEETVAIDPSRALDGRVMVERMAVVMGNPATRPGLAEALADRLGAGDGRAVVIHDSPGFVAQRVLASVVNVASEIAQRGIASPQDIDAAVRLGLGYPKGPLEIGDMMGARHVLRLLEWLHATTGEPRYRASLWLRRRALLGLPLAA